MAESLFLKVVLSYKCPDVFGVYVLKTASESSYDRDKYGRFTCVSIINNVIELAGCIGNSLNYKKSIDRTAYK